MTEAVTLIVKSTDTFEGLVDKVNEIANLVSNSVITATTAANGSTSTGNAYGTGIFSYTTVAVATTLRGGNVQSTAALAIGSNLTFSDNIIEFGNSTVNATVNSTMLEFVGGANWSKTGFHIGNSTVNAVGNTTQITYSTGSRYGTASWSIGNSTVNAVSNSTSLDFGTAQHYRGTTLSIGSATVNVSANTTGIKLSNSTVSFVLSKPTAVQAGGDAYFLKSDGAWSNVENLVLKVYDSSNTQVFP